MSLTAFAFYSYMNDAMIYDIGYIILPCADMFKRGDLHSADGGYLLVIYAVTKGHKICGMIFNNLVVLDTFTGWKLYQVYVYALIFYGFAAWHPEM